MLRINEDRLLENLNAMADAIDRGYSQCATYIGFIGNKPVKVVVSDKEFALEESGDCCPRKPEHECIYYEKNPRHSMGCFCEECGGI